MATINHSAGADIIVPSNNGTTYRGLAGDDTYIISNSIAANGAITIVDTSGANKIQLVDGLSIASSAFAADAVQLTLSNGAVVTINGASNFTYDVGGNATTGTAGTSNTLSAFAASMGVATLPSSGSTAGSSDVTISGNAVSSTASPTFTVTKSASSVDEGSAITFTITASSAVSADTTFSWTVIGDSNGGTVDTAATSDVDVLSGTATIASGATSTTFDVTAASDATVEGIEGIKVSVFDSNATALSSANILINNTGSSATSQSFTLTTGVNEFTGGSGNDSFDGSTNDSLNDYDILDGADGTDTLTFKTANTNGGLSFIPQLSNIEVIQITASDADANASDDIVTVQLSGITGITKVANIASAEDVTFSSLGNLVDVELKSANHTTTVNFTDAALAGASDSITITLKGTTGNTDIVLSDAGVATNSLETVNLVSQSVANTISAHNFSGVSPATINVSGDKLLTITDALDATVTTFDASAATGGVTLTGGNGYGSITYKGGSGADTITTLGVAGNVNITGGAGNDSVDFEATWTGLDTYDGGDGTDTLTFSGTLTNEGASSSVFGGLSNVETIKAQNANDAITLSSNISATTFDVSANNANTVTLNDGYTNATTVHLGYANASTDTIANNANVALTLTGGTSMVTGALNVTGSAGSSDTVSVLNLGGTMTFDADNDVFENITITDYTAGADPTLDLGAHGYALGAGKTVTINTSTLDAGEVFTLDGVQSTNALNVTSGAGADSLIGGTKADTISGGAGNDTIDGTTGNSVITGGDGADQITLTETGAENIDGGAGNDTIVTSDDLDIDDTIDGGDGTDTLTTGVNITTGDSTIFANVSGIEVIKLDGDFDLTVTGAVGGATTFDLSNDAQNLLVLQSAANGGTYTSDTIVKLNTDDVGTDSVTNSANVTLTVRANALDVDDGLTLTGGTGTDTLEITADGNTAVLDDVTNFETITIKDSLTAGTDAAVTVNSGETKTVTIDGTELDGSLTVDETLTVTGTAATGKLVINAGGGADTLLGGTLNDTIDGGAGADAITGNEGADSISGGAGNDTITMDTKAELTSAVGNDTVDGGAGTDTLALGASMNLTAAQLANISNVEVITIPTGSDLTISDLVLTNNPGVSFTFAGNGTLSTGEDTAGASLMTESLNVRSTANGDLKLVGSSSADTFTFAAVGTLTAADTIDGNGGTDIIKVDNDSNGAVTDGVGNATTAAIGTSVTGIEEVLVVDRGLDNDAGDVTITIASGFTGTSLKIDGTALDAKANDPLSTGEVLTVTNSDNTALTVLGGAYADAITSNAGADSLVGNGGADVIKGGDGNDTIEGGDGADTLWGQGGVDSIHGGAGNDTIDIQVLTEFQLSGGVETINGGAGTDTLDFSQDTTTTLTAPELAQLYSVEKITFTNGDNAATATFGNATFTNNGLAGNLTIVTGTGTGATTIDGSAVSNGAFTIIVDNTAANANEKLVGGTGDDIFRFKDTDELTAADTITGGGGSDTLQLDADAAFTGKIDFTDVSGVETVSIYTVDGLSGGVVDLEIDPHSTAALNAGAMTIDYTGLLLHSGKFNEDADDTVKVNFTITGGSKADTINGSLGNDTISGGGTTVGDSLTGGSGKDSVTGNGGADTIGGGAGVDTLSGGAGADNITGGAGNDSIVGGDGVDTLDGEGGADNLTGSAGNDVFLYNAIADSSGNAKDTITDFTQSTLNATTGAVVTAGDSLRVVVGSIDGVWTASDKGDVNNAGEAASAMNNVKGSFVFSKDNDTLYIDMDGDSTLNADDYSFILTDLDSFHGADIDFYLTSGNNADTITTLDGDDSITSANGNDVITSGAGNDTITGGTGTHSVTAGAGNDYILTTTGADTILGGTGDDTIIPGLGIDIVTGGTGDDVFDLDGIVATANRVEITDFEDAGATVGDVVKIAAEATEDGNTTLLTATVDVTLAGSGATYRLDQETTGGSAFTTATTDIVFLTDTNAGDGNLETDFDTNGIGTELLKILSSGTGTTADGIQMDNSADKIVLVAYDNGAAYVYHVDGTTANAKQVAADIIPIAKIDGVTADTMVAADFLLV